MIAYLFWHRPERTEGTGGYEEALAGFHRQLAADRPPFLLGCATYRVEGAPWVDGREGDRGYEDWYLVRGFADLELLNEAAVSARFRAGHDRVAAMAAWGTAGVYAVVRGQPAWAARTVTWLGKPGGVPYPEFLASLPETACLVQRQLVLGPTPEFCAAGELEGGLVVRRDPVFVSAEGAG